MQTLQLHDIEVVQGVWTNGVVLDRLNRLILAKPLVAGLLPSSVTHGITVLWNLLNDNAIYALTFANGRWASVTSSISPEYIMKPLSLSWQVVEKERLMSAINKEIRGQIDKAVEAWKEEHTNPSTVVEYVNATLNAEKKKLTLAALGLETDWANKAKYRVIHNGYISQLIRTQIETSASLIVANFVETLLADPAVIATIQREMKSDFISTLKHRAHTRVSDMVNAKINSLLTEALGELETDD